MSAALLVFREAHRSGRLLATKVTFEAARCLSPLQKKSSKTTEQTNKDDTSNNMDNFIQKLVSNKTELWKNKHKLKKSGARDSKIFATVKMGEVTMEEENLTDKHKTYTISLLKLAIDGEKYEEDEMLKILESPEILCKVEPQVLENLANAFIKVDFTEGIFQLEATSHRLPNPPLFDFIGSLFQFYRSSNQRAKALTAVEKFYTKFPNSRREARSHLATIIRDVVSNHSSDALLVQCKQLALRLNKNFADSRPVIYLWHACFISEWFSDQQVARELLTEISLNKSLAETFSKKLMTATYSALGRGKPELVQGLIEDLIGNNLHSQLTVPIRLLFDYKCQLGDLRGCAAIMKSTADLNVILTSKQHQDFLELMTYRKHFRWKPERHEEKPAGPEEFKFKF